MTEIYRFTEGHVPVLVSMPHVGTALMPGLAERLSDAARPLGDTDWHLPELYDFLGDLGCSTLVATHSRFVVDLNRPPDDKPLYAGAAGALALTGSMNWLEPTLVGVGALALSLVLPKLASLRRNPS